MSQPVASLALLKVTWDHLHRDSLDGLLPFVATLICEFELKAISQDDIPDFCDSFQARFGLAIPFHPMVALLERARRRKLLRREHGVYVPVATGISEFEFSEAALDQARKHNRLIDRLVEFCATRHDHVITTEAADDMLLGFLKDHDLDVLFASQNRSVLPAIKPSRKAKYLVGSFVAHAHERDPEVFGYVLDVAVGHVLASLVLYRDMNVFRGSLNKLHIYLDTRFVLFLLGVYGEQRKAANLSLLEALKAAGCKVRVFQHSYDEILGILEGAHKWIASNRYDPARASDVLQYFIESGYRESDVQRFILHFPGVLSSQGIDVFERPDPNENQIYQVSEARLKECILDAYGLNESDLDPNRDQSLQRDISSIAAVYKLRQGACPTTIKQASHVFVTTNSRLAFADTVFEKEFQPAAFCIPCCITDVFLGTLIWLQSPSRVADLSEKRLIAEAYAAVQPSKELVRLLAEEAHKLRNEEVISEDEWIVLQSDRVARELLAEKTLGDPENFGSQTAREIIEEWKRRERAEERQRFEVESAKHQNTQRELQRLAEEHESLRKKLTAQARRNVDVTLQVMKAIWIMILIIAAMTPLLKDWLPAWASMIGLLISSVLVIIGGMWRLDFHGFSDRVRGRLTAYFERKSGL